MSVLDLPARKVFIRDIARCSRVPTLISSDEVSQVGKKTRQWQIECSGIEFRTSVVWIQGLVTETNKEEDYLILNDNTGKAKVLGVRSIPYISPSLEQGQYIMIIAHISKPGEIPLLRALKLQNLIHINSAEESWSLEVMDQILHLSVM